MARTTKSPATARSLPRARASAKHVAERAGVSVETVWQIMGGRGSRYNADTRSRVEEVARALGYRRNGGAVAISTGSFRCVAMITSTVSSRSVWESAMFAGLERRLGRVSHHLTIACLGDNDLRGEGALDKLLRERMADGLIINHVYDMPPDVEQAIAAQDLRAVWINRKLPSACAYPDDFAAGRDATAALIALGHRRIAYLSSHPTPHYSDADRAAGHAAAMAAAGLSPRTVMSPDPPHEREAWMRRLRVLLKGSDRPTAVVAYGPFAAYPVLQVASDLGLRVPSDLSIATFAPNPACDAGPTLTTWLIPYTALGDVIGDLALAAIAGKPTPARAIPFSGMVGATSAPRPG